MKTGFEQALADVLTHHYALGSITGISSLDDVNSKYQTPHHHFLASTTKGLFFVKKLHANCAPAVLWEANIRRQLLGVLKIPEILGTTEGEYWLNCDGYILVVYYYIENLALFRPTKSCRTDFYDAVCFVNQRLLHAFPTLSFFDPNLRYRAFEQEVKLLKAIILQSGPRAQNSDIEYISFLESEALNLAKIVSNLRIPLRFVHGDLLCQNLGKDEKGIIWVLDWEMASHSVASVDIARSVTFTNFDPFDDDALGMDVDRFASEMVYCIQKCTVPPNEVRQVMNLYCFYLTTNLAHLTKYYIWCESYRPEMSIQDYNLCRWFIDNRMRIQALINAQI